MHDMIQKVCFRYIESRHYLRMLIVYDNDTYQKHKEKRDIFPTPPVHSDLD